MTTYWFSDFSSLFKSININPFMGQDKNFKYNSLTRLIVLITVISSILFNDNINEILIAGIISLSLSVIIYLSTYNSQETYKSQDTYISAAKAYKDATKIAEEQKYNLTIDSTPISEIIVKDYIQNVKNQVAIRHSPMDTEKLKGMSFLDGDKSPAIVTHKYLNPYDYVSHGDQVQTGTMKKFSSLLDKNLGSV